VVKLTARARHSIGARKLPLDGSGSPPPEEIPADGSSKGFCSSPKISPGLPFLRCNLYRFKLCGRLCCQLFFEQCVHMACFNARSYDGSVRLL